MGSSRTPGSLGAETNRPAVDSGTLVRSATPAPRAVGTMTAARACATGRGPCACTGSERTTISGLDRIQSYSGEFPSPLQVMWYTPTQGEPLRLEVPDQEIRQWIRQAAEYHGVPHILLAVILQQENAPGATMMRKFLQFGERSVTTFGAVLDELLLGIVPDAVACGSSGFANMKRQTLRQAAAYSESMYGRSPMPPEVQYRLLGWDQDTRIPGDDWRADLYYCAAHLRELIDRVTGRRCHHGALNPQQLSRVIAAYNGSGPAAEKYARDAIKLLSDAAAGNATLYFYER